MKILVASNEAPGESCDAINAAQRFPWPEGSEFRVLTVAGVIQPAVAVAEMVPDIPAALDAADAQLGADTAAESAAERAAAQLRRQGFQAKGVISEGDPEIAIVDYAKEWGADVIVLGSSERSGMERLLLGSVPEYVVRRSPCSVLVVKRRPA